MKQQFAEENLSTVNKDRVYQLAKVGSYAFDKGDYRTFEEIYGALLDGMAKQKEVNSQKYEENYSMGGMGYFASYQLALEALSMNKLKQDAPESTKDIYKRANAIWPQNDIK